MKKIVKFKLISKKIFILIFLYFVFCININAETLKCEYIFGEQNDEIYTFEFDITKGTLKNLDEKENESKWLVIFTQDTMHNYEYYYHKEEIKLYKKNVCPMLFMAKEHQRIASGHNNYTDVYNYYIYTEVYIKNNGGEKCLNNVNAICLSNFFGVFNYKYYYVSKLTDSETNKNKMQEQACASYDLIDAKLEETLDKYKNCTDEDCISLKTIINQKMIELKEICNSILSNKDYYIEHEGDNKKIKDLCIEKCLNKFPERIKEVEVYDNSNDTCGFSERLISFIGNILKWIKYILPVIVMVLGILDFIKALSSEKDDEMKKNQGRFMKRLIAAALVFLIPLIIEFVLNKMGFDYNECGLF